MLYALRVRKYLVVLVPHGMPLNINGGLGFPCGLHPCWLFRQ
nr:MAG TPA: hypothetical protein [Caudoviricetes sp.]